MKGFVDEVLSLSVVAAIKTALTLDMCFIVGDFNFRPYQA